MKYYTIDFRNVTSLSDFYQRIIKGLEFPEWCGESLDAIWDMLTGYMQSPAHIDVIGWNLLTNHIRDRCQMFKETLDEAIEWYKDLDEQLVVVYK